MLPGSTHGSLEQVLRDRWITAEHEEDAFESFIEPEFNIADQKRIDSVVLMGFSQEEIQTSLSKMKSHKIPANILVAREKIWIL